MCGDLMQIQIRVEDGVLTDVQFKMFGCGAAIATSSKVTDLAIGKTIEERLRLRATTWQRTSKGSRQ
jgi:nitrogen fixation NifU-like protein